MSIQAQNTISTLAMVVALTGFAWACGGANSRPLPADGTNPVAAGRALPATCTSPTVPRGVSGWSDALGTALEEGPEAALASLEASLRVATESAEPLFAAQQPGTTAGSGEAASGSTSPEQAAALRAWFGTWVQTPWPLLTLDARGFVLADEPACAVLAAARQSGPRSHRAAIDALAPWLREALRPETSCVRACSAR